MAKDNKPGTSRQKQGPTKQEASHQKTGREGEAAACDFLIGKGYEILETNYRYKRSEIDIIARKAQLLVFVEVKTKSYSSFGYPEEAVGTRKAQKVIEGAENYIYEHNWEKNIRFDIIAIDNSSNEILHLEDAFY